MARYVYHYRFWLRLDPSRPTRWGARRARTLIRRAARAPAGTKAAPARPEHDAEAVLEGVLATVLCSAVPSILVLGALHAP